jgi:hypothetical protein
VRQCGVRPLRSRSADTDAEAERVQLELLRSASPGRRTALALSLSATVISLARRALRAQAPAASEQEIGLRFVELSYGRELAAEVAAFLATHRR